MKATLNRRKGVAEYLTRPNKIVGAWISKGEHPIAGLS